MPTEGPAHVEITDEMARALDAVIEPIVSDNDMPCLDDYKRALRAALGTRRGASQRKAWRLHSYFGEAEAHTSGRPTLSEARADLEWFAFPGDDHMYIEWCINGQWIPVLEVFS